MKVVKKNFWIGIMAALSLSFLFVTTSCNDDDEPMGTGDVEFAVTDAPIDDAEVQGVFVTITDIKVDGESFDGFTGTQTIDLKAYSEGNTKMIGNGTLDARNYNSVTLVLDLQHDAAGNSPGSYVLTDDDTKYALSSSSDDEMDITLDKDWSITKNAENNIVFDFDLRKSIKRDDDGDGRYRFVTTADLKNSIRVIAKEKSAKIMGSYEENVITNADRVVVFAYKKGTFNEATETTADANGRRFVNAVTSAEVNDGIGSDDYTLAFVPQGEYELYFVTYDEDGDDGEVSFDSVLDSDMMIDGSPVNSVNLTAGTDIDVDIEIIGL